MVAVAIVGGIFVASSIPNLAFTDNVLIDTAVRKMGHVAAFFAFSFVTCLALTGRSQLRTIFVTVIAAALLVALADELNQSTIPGRLGSVLDVLLDMAGALAGLRLYLFFIRRREATNA